MIISKYSLVKIGSISLKYYRSKNYICNINDNILVKVIDLLPTTKCDVLVECDFCGKEVVTLYRNYYYQYNKNEKFSCCQKCTENKVKLTNLKKYGKCYSNQSEFIKNKTKINSIKKLIRYNESTLLNIKPKYIENVLNKDVIITINKWNIEHFKKLNYSNLIINQKYIVPIEHLMLNSSVKVDCKCSFCDNVKTMTFQKYITNYNRNNFYSCVSCNNKSYVKTMNIKYGVDNCSSIPSVIEKKKNTNIKKYGNEYSIASDEIRDKIRKKLIERFGGHQTMNNEIMSKIVEKSKITKINRGLMISDDKLSDWNLYKKNVKKITNNNRKILLEKWDGFDFYDGEYIKDNFKINHIDRMYPTLDHKLSVYYGYNNNLSVEYISDISNLCFTKRYINSIKSKMTIDEYVAKKN